MLKKRKTQTVATDILRDLPRGQPGRSPEDFQTPYAAFADPQQVSRRLAYQSGQLFLGVLGGEVVDGPGGIPCVKGGTPIGIEDDRHALTLAPTRAGKGRAIIVPNLLLWPHSVLAIDPKGELAELTAGPRARSGQKVHVLDPFGVAKLPAGASRAAFNPLAGLDEQTVIEAAARIADALVVVSGKEPHWDESAKNFIEGVITHVVTDPYYKDRADLGTVRRVMAAASEGGTLESEMRNNPAAEGLVELAAGDFFDRPANERDSVLSTARRHLKFLDFPEMRRVLQGHDFTLADLKTQATTVYLCLPARHMGTCSRWLRLFVNLALQEMEKTPGRPATGGPVLFCMDEFATLGHMRSIEDAAGQIAGFGVKLWPILQDLTQLKALYGERWETFMGNAGVLQFFGNNDLTTLEWISKRCGKTTVKVRRDAPVSASDQAKSGLSGETWASELHDLLSVEEAGRFFGREDAQFRQLIIRPGKDPIILQRAYYDQHEMFARLI